MANSHFDPISIEGDVEISVDHLTGYSTSASNGLTATPEVDRYGFLFGAQYTDPTEGRRFDPSVLRKRELKWLDMLEDWEKWMTKKFKKVKRRCRKGIPPGMRAKAWHYLCGGKVQMDLNPGLFQVYLSQNGDQKHLDDIVKDLHRQFPNHEMFLSKGGYGQTDLFNVLKAYTVRNPHDGYCQAQAPIAAVLLMHMPAEHAFWCLVAICETYVTGYYSPGLEAIQLDGEVLIGLVRKVHPAIYRHLKKLSVDPIMFMTEWFMCLFTRNLPWASVLRVWDAFLCEGVKVLFRLAILILHIALGSPQKMAECSSFFECMEKLRLRKMPSELFDEDFISSEALHVSITERDMEKEHQKQIARGCAMSAERQIKSKRKT